MELNTKVIALVFVVAFLFAIENEASTLSTYRKKKSKIHTSNFNFMAFAKEFIGGFYQGFYELIHGSSEVQNYFQNIVLQPIDTSTKPILIIK